MAEAAGVSAAPERSATARARVLVKERIAEGGVELLRERFDVDVEIDMPADELADRIAGYDALIVRSATAVDADLLARAERLKVVGRAGTGVDNVDVAEATRRGIIVANAPGSNMVSAAEHAIGLLLSLARNIPQAHAALSAGRWERSRFGGVEVCGKTLGILGFGRIGQLVAAARPWAGHAGDRSRPVRDAGAVPRAAGRPLQPRRGARAGRLHHPARAADGGDAAPGAGRDDRAHADPGVRIVNAARGDLIDIDALVAALKDGRVAGAALDVFPSEPYTDGEVLTLPNVVVTPHLGASTQEAQDRAGLIVAEQVVAALAGEFVSNAVNIPLARAEDMEVMGPFLPLASKLGRLAAGLSGGGFDRIEVTCSGALAESDTRLLTSAVLAGAFAGHVDDHINLVNARAIADGMGIRVLESAEPTAGDFTNLVTVAVTGEAVSGTVIGRDNRPWLVGVHPYQVEIELDAHMIVMLNDDRPGMIGRVGTLLGEEGANIANMNVSRNVRGEAAVMVLSVDTPPEARVLDRLRAEEGIHSVRLVSLTGI